jgi:Flp pilus assembly pilin Flp
LVQDKTREVAMLAVVKPLLRNVLGVTAIEYAAMTAIIAVAVVTVLHTVGSGLANTFGNVATNL